MKKIKVVQVVEAMLGGIRQHVIDIVENLNPDIYDIYLIYSDKRADQAFFDEKEKLEKYATLILCNEMQREIGMHDFAAYKALVQHFKDIRPDIVHCHSSKAGIVGRMAAKKCKVKLVLYTPNAYAFETPNISPIKKTIYIFAERFLSRHATNMTINVSKGEMSLAYNYNLDKKEKFILIYNAIPNKQLLRKDILKTKLSLKDDTRYVGVTARCAIQKDPKTFLAIAEKVTKKLDDVEFIYIGDGELFNEMQEYIDEHGLKEKVHLLGFRSDASDVVGVLDVYLSTALYEGLPYSMIEAMRAGVPIIATDTVGNNELVIDRENGFLFNVGDVEKGEELIIKQLQDNLIKTDDVFKRYLELFDLCKMIEDLEKIYMAIIKDENTAM